MTNRSSQSGATLPSQLSDVELSVAKQPVSWTSAKAFKTVATVAFFSPLE